MIYHGDPFEFSGMLWICTSIAVDSRGGAEIEAYRIVPPERFRGGDAGEKNGFYHGEQIIHDGRSFCLEGPPGIFEAVRQLAGAKQAAGADEAPGRAQPSGPGRTALNPRLA